MNHHIPVQIKVVYRGHLQHYILRYMPPNTIKGAAVGYSFIPPGHVKLSQFHLVRKFRTWDTIREAMQDAFMYPTFARDWNGNSFDTKGHSFEGFIIDGVAETDPDFLKII